VKVYLLLCRSHYRYWQNEEYFDPTAVELVWKSLLGLSTTGFDKVGMIPLDSIGDGLERDCSVCTIFPGRESAEATKEPELP